MVTIWNHLDIASDARGGKIAKVCSHDIYRFKMPNSNLIAYDTGVIFFGKFFRMLKFNFVSCELRSLPRPKTQLLISNIQDGWFKAKTHDRVFVLPKNSWQNFRLICKFRILNSVCKFVEEGPEEIASWTRSPPSVSTRKSLPGNFRKLIGEHQKIGWSYHEGSPLYRWPCMMSERWHTENPSCRNQLSFYHLQLVIALSEDLDLLILCTTLTPSSKSIFLPSWKLIWTTKENQLQTKAPQIKETEKEYLILLLHDTVVEGQRQKTSLRGTKRVFQIKTQLEMWKTIVKLVSSVKSWPFLSSVLDLLSPKAFLYDRVSCPVNNTMVWEMSMWILRPF